jgi:hypothetical protein
MVIELILLVLVVAATIRMVTGPFRFGPRYRRFYGYDPYYNPYRYGCRRHHRLLGGILPIVVLVALDRILNRRYW